MRWVWSPLARRSGVKEEREVIRFAEQGWALAVYSVSWSTGLVRSLALFLFQLYAKEKD